MALPHPRVGRYRTVGHVGTNILFIHTYFGMPGESRGAGGGGEGGGAAGYFPLYIHTVLVTVCRSVSTYITMYTLQSGADSKKKQKGQDSGSLARCGWIIPPPITPSPHTIQRINFYAGRPTHSKQQQKHTPLPSPLPPPTSSPLLLTSPVFCFGPASWQQQRVRDCRTTSLACLPAWLTTLPTMQLAALFWTDSDWPSVCTRTSLVKGSR